MMAFSGTELEELGSEGSFEDEEVQVDHGRGARRVVERVTLFAGSGRNGSWSRVALDVWSCCWSTLDDGIDVVGHGRSWSWGRKARAGGRIDDAGWMSAGQLRRYAMQSWEVGDDEKGRKGSSRASWASNRIRDRLMQMPAAK